MRYVNKHIIYLAVNTNTDPKKITYEHRILIQDTSGRQYTFVGNTYAYDESGKAREDLEVLQTINFTEI